MSKTLGTYHEIGKKIEAIHPPINLPSSCENNST